MTTPQAADYDFKSKGGSNRTVDNACFQECPAEAVRLEHRTGLPVKDDSRPPTGLRHLGPCRRGQRGKG